MTAVVKKLIRGILLLITLLLSLVLVVWVQQVKPEQQPPDFIPYQFADTLAGRDYDLDSLKAIIGIDKGLPVGFEEAAAIAFSAYPLLKEVAIDMVLTDYGPPMRADIDIWSLLGSRKHRKYVITLNDVPNSFFEPILLRSLPFDAQVGILAHELGHVVYYHQLNALQLAKWGLSYLRDDDFRGTHERTTDLMPVYHGLGSQIYQYAHYVRRHPNCQELYQIEQGFMDRYYMTDWELKKVIDNN